MWNTGVMTLLPKLTKYTLDKTPTGGTWSNDRLPLVLVVVVLAAMRCTQIAQLRILQCIIILYIILSLSLCVYCIIFPLCVCSALL